MISSVVQAIVSSALGPHLLMTRLLFPTQRRRLQHREIPESSFRRSLSSSFILPIETLTSLTESSGSTSQSFYSNSCYSLWRLKIKSWVDVFPIECYRLDPIVYICAQHTWTTSSVSFTIQVPNLRSQIKSSETRIVIKIDKDRNTVESYGGNWKLERIGNSSGEETRELRRTLRVGRDVYNLVNKKTLKIFLTRK